jgi:hypothetical protein
MAYMATTGSSTSSVTLTISHSLALLNYRTITNTTRIEPFNFLVAQYLICANSYLGIGLGSFAYLNSRLGLGF